MLVDKVEDVLAEDSTSYEDTDHSMYALEWSDEDDGMNEEMGDDLTLEQAQEELRKDLWLEKVAIFRMSPRKKGEWKEVGVGHNDFLMVSTFVFNLYLILHVNYVDQIVPILILYKFIYDESFKSCFLEL